MYRIRLITDVPTPYRNFTYARMAELMPPLGIEIEIWFMAMGDRRRFERYTEADLHFPHRSFGGVHPYLRGIVWHFNPGLLRAVRAKEIDAIIVGGWASPSHLLAPLLSRSTKLLWTEGNGDAMQRTRGIAPIVKRRIIDTYDGYIVSQERSEQLIGALSPASRDRPFIRFPNLIDGAVFRDDVVVARTRRDAIRNALGIAPTTQLWFCPARLSPEKGLEEFAPLLRSIENVALLVAGDGPRREAIEALAKRHALPLRLLGQQSQKEIVDLYAAADLFVLPSLWDSSPLSAIEACAAGLPLLVSSRIGNFQDVLGDNGWAYEVTDPATMRARLVEIAATPRAELAAMGAKSRQRYDERFDTDTCIRRLAHGLVEVLESRERHAHG